MVKWGLVIDITKCNGCYNCFLACKDEFWNNDHLPYSAAQPRHGHFWIRILTEERGQYPHVHVAHMPIPCMQCNEAPCIKKAKNNAIYTRPDGIVIIDPEKAVDQKKLLEACPYGSIFWNEEKKLPQKCTFCAHLLDKGWKEPRCVQACPTGALIFGDFDDPESNVFKFVATGKAEPFHSEYGTKPNVYYISLHRITKCFLAGSVAFKDTDECAENVKVTLTSKQTSLTKTASTNNYGDFEFDGLDPGDYTISLTYPGYKAKKINVQLEKSTYLGYIFIEKA